MSQSNLTELLSRVTELASSSQSAAMAVLARIYRKPIENDQMAQSIVRANHHLEDENDDFAISFITRLKAYTLHRNGNAETLSGETVTWLIGVLEVTKPYVRLSEVDLVLGIVAEAPPEDDRLANWLVTQLCKRMIRIGHARREETRRLAQALKLCRSPVINRNEARLLLMVNDAVAGQYNDMSWPIVFSRSVGNFLLAFAHPDPKEASETLHRMKWVTADRRNGDDLTGNLAQEFDRFGWFDRLAVSVKHAETAREVASEYVQSRKKLSSPVKRSWKKSQRLDNSMEPEVEWLKKRLGWRIGGSPAERALTYLIDSQAPGFLKALTVAVPA